jgi:hypothetical protein
MKPIILSFLLTLRAIAIFSQDSTSVKSVGKFSVNGYADLYYQWAGHNIQGHAGLPFMYNFRKKDELGTDLILLRSSYENKNWKASLGIMTGDYSKNNLAAESGFFRHIYEANVGYSLSPKTEVVVGILPSHIGFESAIAKENWNLSRSVLAENSPYYETGIKFNYSRSEKLKLSFLLLNGWQHIRDDNRSLSFGTQAQVKLSSKTSLNSSTYLGKEGPDSISKFRAFHNFFLTYEIDTKNNIALLFDIGIQQTIRPHYANWWGAALLYQHKFCPALLAAGRIEYYRDPQGSIISFYQPRAFSLFSYSVNIDYVRLKWFSLRMETRFMKAGIPVFEDNGQGSRMSMNLLICIAFYF